jgi:hypothetical protein
MGKAPRARRSLASTKRGSAKAAEGSGEKEMSSTREEEKESDAEMKSDESVPSPPPLVRVGRRRAHFKPGAEEPSVPVAAGLDGFGNPACESSSAAGGRLGVPGVARGGVLGEVELDVAAAEAERGGVVGARGVLGSGSASPSHCAAAPLHRAPSPAVNLTRRRRGSTVLPPWRLGSRHGRPGSTSSSFSPHHCAACTRRTPPPRPFPRRGSRPYASGSQTSS